VISAIGSEVWLPILTLVLGYVFSLITEAVRDRRQSEREKQTRADERDAVKAARLEEVDQRRREFQRATLLELQEVLYELGRTVSQSYVAALREFRRIGSWSPVPAIDDDADKNQADMNRRSNILVARIEDEQLQTLVRGMKDASAAVVFAASEPDATKAIQRFMATHERIDERVGELLPGLY
jgi:hypothetical protein